MRTAKPPLFEDVSVDHRGFHVLGTEEFLHSADFLVILQSVGGIAMAEGVRGDVLKDVRRFGCSSDGSLHGALV
jgi:hypothetical protein